MDDLNIWAGFLFIENKTKIECRLNTQLCVEFIMYINIQKCILYIYTSIILMETSDIYVHCTAMSYKYLQ